MATLSVILALSLTLILSGCGPANPQAVVTNFLKAGNDADWNAFREAILPDQVRSMTDIDAAYWHNIWLKAMSTNMSWNLKTLKFKTSAIKKDKNGNETAKVTITAGLLTLKKATGSTDVVINFQKKVATFKDPETGKPTSQDLDGNIDKILSQVTQVLVENQIAKKAPNIEVTADLYPSSYTTSYTTVKYKGRWYVDFTLEQQKSSQLQQIPVQ